jgi:hypothetical protein
MQKYYIIENTNPNLEEIFNLGVGVLEKQHEISSGIILKLPIGDEGNYTLLDGYPSYTKQGIHEVLAIEYADVDPMF